MEWIAILVDLVLHLDKHLAALTATYGAWIYLILFLIVFSETGLVVFPFLPGDSLLFIAGSLAALGGLNVHIVVGVLFVAAVLGNSLNYEIGRWVGPKVFVNRQSRWLNPEHVERTHAFFERWGGVAVILARFVPFLRTYVPFVAGVGAMHRGKYQTYTVTGAMLWVGSLTYLGYFFGNIPWIKSNQGIVVIAILVISLIPVAIGVLRGKPR